MRLFSSFWGHWSHRRLHCQEVLFWVWKKYKTSNIGSMSYGHFPARNGSKSTITPQKSDKANRDYTGSRWKMIIRHKTKGGYLMFLHLSFSASKSRCLTMRPPLTSMASKNGAPKYFENSIIWMQIFQRSMRVMNHR